MAEDETAGTLDELEIGKHLVRLSIGFDGHAIEASHERVRFTPQFAPALTDAFRRTDTLSSASIPSP